MGRTGNRLAGKAALAASAAMLAVAVPSSVFAIGMIAGEAPIVENDSRFAFTPAVENPAMARVIASFADSEDRLMRFTPASATAATGERAMTVAVRLNRQTADSLSVNSMMASARMANVAAKTGLSLAPTRYNLGLARGYGNFSQGSAPSAPSVSAPQLSRSLSGANIPDLATMKPNGGVRHEPSRFAARVELDNEGGTARSRTARDTVNDQLLDVGGSYRLTRNLDITAGVRYEQDRDLVPLPDVEQQDSQAVYIGTQFRF